MSKPEHYAFLPSVLQRRCRTAAYTVLILFIYNFSPNNFAQLFCFPFFIPSSLFYYYSCCPPNSHFNLLSLVPFRNFFLPTAFQSDFFTPPQTAFQSDFFTPPQQPFNLIFSLLPNSLSILPSVLPCLLASFIPSFLPSFLPSQKK